MAIVLRSVTVATNTGSSPTIAATTPSAGDPAQVGDVVLVVHGNDFYALTAMPSPTATGSPTLTLVPSGTADGGTGEGHIKPYTYVVNTGGAQTVSVTETGTADEEKDLAVWVWAGVDSAAPVDIAANLNGTPGNDHQICPGVTTNFANSMLVCINNSGPTSTASYGSPISPFVEQYEIHVGGMSGVGGNEPLGAAGATGSREYTCVPGDSHLWVASTIALKAAAGGGGIATPKQALVVPSPAVQSWSW